ncbi:MAG: M20 family metallopeptidase [Acidobacteria bacterium]|nr:M20 family metallopeptidase [Acidobacteriota bacterium]
MDVTQLKARAATAIRADATRLIALSGRIHATPELGYAEYQASRWVADALVQSGFAVSAGVCDLPTAFIADSGTGTLTIGVCAEYDALPGIGHACGHNLIATMGVGAGIGLASVAADLDIRVRVLGTPAEEVGNAGGKDLMLERGAFDGVHAAMMVHPGPFDVLLPPLIAAATFDVHYEGRAAHAAAFPELAINAADALTVAQVAIGLLRQHLPAGDRVHGIVTHGGDMPNIVPALASARYTIRSHSLEGLDALRARVMRCFDAGALATGATLRVDGGDRPYAEVVHDREMAAYYRANAAALGRTFVDSGPAVDRAAASTDMGNVSRVIPSIHPMIGLGCFPVVNHQPAFADRCLGPVADAALVDGAIAMAWTAVDMATSASARDRLLSHRSRT